MSILVTGGTGYIGSHTVVELIGSGEDVVIVDNLSNSSITVLDRIEKITSVRPAFYREDACDAAAMDRIFDAHEIDAVIHFASLKAVGESVIKPLEYYRTNIDSAVTTMECMRRHGCKCFIFSSSATVYGDPASVPIREDFPVATPTSPYGKTKMMIEQIMQDVYAADSSMSMVILRYFNPIGAHSSGLIGEEPNGIPNNLMPYITQVAAGKLPLLHVYGHDYPTRDGTGVRDYIHVVDLADGHIKALKHKNESGVFIYNLGTGIGYSVLDIINSFEAVNGIKIPYEFAPRRPGDIAENYADPTKAEKLLGWKAKYGIDDMCASSWNYIKNTLEGKV